MGLAHARSRPIALNILLRAEGKGGRRSLPAPLTQS
jgi:hypothetical protein